MLEDLYQFYFDAFASSEYTSALLAECVDEFITILTMGTIIAVIAIVISFFVFAFKFIGSLCSRSGRG